MLGPQVPEWRFETAGRSKFYSFSNNDRKAEKIIDNGRTYAQLFGSSNISPTGTSRYKIRIIRNTKNALDAAYGVGIALETSNLDIPFHGQNHSHIIFIGTNNGTLVSDTVFHNNYLKMEIKEGMTMSVIVDMEDTMPTLRIEVNGKPVGVPWQLNLSIEQRKHLRPAVTIAWVNDVVELV